MLRPASVVFLAVCLLALSACQTVLSPPMLEIQGQSVEDNTVIIKAVIDGPGWLVLHPATAEGEPDTGTALARAYLPTSGEYSDISMTVAGTVFGETTVFVILYYDDPADGEFTFSPGMDDDPPVMVEDEIAAVSFTMSGISPYVAVQDDGIEDGTITVKAAIDRPGWLVVRPATPLGKPDTSKELGHIPLAEPGEYPGIKVTVPTGTAGEYVIFVMLYYDDPEDGEFTFSPGGVEDPPVEVEGSTVQKALRVSG